MKFEIEATIPTTQYGNIRPKFIIEKKGEEEDALDMIKSLWSEYGEKPLVKKINNSSANDKKLTSFTGETIIYNDDAHAYFDEAGNKLMSGSVYAKLQTKPFDTNTVLDASANKWNVDKQDLSSYWSMLGDVSRNYGNAIHKALEAYHKYHTMGKTVQDSDEKRDENYVLPKIPHIKECVEEFIEKYGVDAETEVLVSDIKNGMAGQIDRLQIIDKDKKVCRVGDFKTNAELPSKKKKEYQHQLSFYSHILMNHGWTVEGLDIYHYSGKWEKTSLEVLDLAPFR